MVTSLLWAAGAIRTRADFRPELTERTFRYGDGVFATLRLRGGLLLDARAHVERLAHSAEVLGLFVPEPVDTADGLAGILSQIGAGPETDGVVRVQVSAGTGGRGYGRGHGERADSNSACWELVELLPAPAERSLTLTVLDDGAVPLPAFPNVKSCNALPHVMCARLAARSGCEEALRVSDGSLLEAAASNVFWTSKTCLFTPSASLPLYPGVTRSVVLSVAETEGWTIREGRFGASELAQADSVFLTNAVRGIEPVQVVDGVESGWSEEASRLRSAAESARDLAAVHLR